MFPIIQKGTKLRSRTTGAEVTVVATEYDMWGMTYTIEIAGLKRHYTYDTLMQEYSVISDLPRVDDKAECKCGGLKTYKSLDSIYHSRWCYYGKE